MTNFIQAYHTDVGIRKQKNQDSILLQGMKRDDKDILIAVMCDGMGGMDKGELASATVVRAFGEWFRLDYVHDPNLYDADRLCKQWAEIIADCNERMIAYGKRENIQLGTTMTAVMIQSDGRYFIAHVGDTRAYYVGDQLLQLTEDQTLVAREVRLGNMTEEQAKTDKRRSVLLQCIGINRVVEPQFLMGNLPPGQALLLCSDGFRHVISEVELFNGLLPAKFRSNDDIKQELIRLIELNKQRGETDNISAIYIKRLSE